MANKLVVSHDNRLATTPLTTISLTTRQAIYSSAATIVTNGNGIYYAVDNDGGVVSWLSEDDGVSWEQVEDVPNGNEPVFWTGARWQNGLDYSSIDGRDWVNRTTSGTLSAECLFRLNGYVAARVVDGFTGYKSYRYLSAEDTWTSSSTNYSSPSDDALVCVNHDESEAVLVQGHSVELITDITAAKTIAVQNPVTPGSFDSQDVLGYYWVGGGWDTTDSKWYLFGSIVTPPGGGAPPSHLGQFIWVTSTDGLTWGTINVEAWVGYPRSVLFDGTNWWTDTYVDSSTSQIVKFDGTTFTRTTLGTASGDGTLGGMSGFPIQNLPQAGINGTLTESTSLEAIEGITITLQQDTDLNGSYETTIGTCDTSSNGSFFFDFVDPGNYRLSVGSMPSGCVVPSAQTFTVSAGETETRTFTFDAASISGTVFLDPAVDGVFSGSEDPVEGYTVKLYLDNVLADSTLTDVDGTYAFTLLLADDYRVDLLSPDGFDINNEGYDPTNGDSASYTLVAGQDQVRNFGIATCTITGTLFRDGDGDGVNDDALAYGAYPSSVALVGASTDFESIDGSQNFSYTLKVAGTYYLYVPNTGANDSYIMTSGNDTELVSFENHNVIAFTLGVGEDIDFDMGVALKATVNEITYDDLNEDGTFVDPPDVLADHSVDVDYERSDVGAGVYSAYNTSLGFMPGDYRATFTVTDVPFGSHGFLPSGSPVLFNLTEGESQDVYFGALELFAVTGKVFLDTDYDGVLEGEAGISGITVRLMDGVTEIDSDVTDGSGLYELLSTAGSYTVVVTPGAYVGTTVTEQAISLTDDEVVNFGLIQPGTVTVHAWEDLDGDGVIDGGETTFTVGGVVVGVYEGLTLIDSDTIGVSGEVTFDLTPGSYVVRIISVPGGYQATTGDRSLTLTPSEDDNVNIGVRLDTGDPIRPSLSGWGFLPLR